MTTSGLITRQPDGRYDAGEATRAYVAHLKRPGARASVSAVHAELRHQQAEMVKLKLARMRSELMLVSEHDELIAEVVGLFVAEIEALPARVAGRDLVLRRHLETAVSETRERLSAAAAEKAKAAEPSATVG